MSTEWMLVKLIAAWLMPPLSLIVISLAGLWIARRHRKTGLGLAFTGLAMLWLLSTRVVADALIAPIERTHPAITLAQAKASGAQAIVILGGGTSSGATEYGGETVALEPLARLRWGARLAQASGLPVLVTGGRPDGHRASEATLMADALERDFQQPVRWREERSINTIENARLSREILAGAGVKRVLLVTSASHMPRSVDRFRNAGLEVVPAPTMFLAQTQHAPHDWLPSAFGLQVSQIAVREWLGMLYSRLRGV